MYHKVRITKLPGKARGGKVNGNRIVPNQSLSFGGADMKSGPKDISVANTISAVPRNQANLEAEGGETVYGDINGDGMAEHLVIKGPRHSSGGVPLNLPDDTFIFSDTKSMRLKDPNLLAQFGKKGGASKSTKSYTPAELAKQYDLSKYRKMLQDPESGDLERKTAEIMIRNYTMKLGALALAQESKKGFPQGIPEAARPYMDANGIKDEDLIPEIVQQQQMQSFQEEGMEQGSGMQNPQEEMMEMPQEDMMAMQQPMAQYGYQMPFYQGEVMPSYMQSGGSLTQYQDKGEVKYKYDIPTNAVVVNRADYKTDEEYEVGKADQFAKAGDKPLYILMPDGKYKKITKGAKKLDPYTGTDLATTWNNSQDAADLFQGMGKSIDSPEFTRLLTNYTTKALKDPLSYKSSKGKINPLYGTMSKKDYTPEQIKGAFTTQQKRNLALQAHGVNSKHFSNSKGTLLTADELIKKGQAKDLSEANSIIKQYKDKGISDIKSASEKVGVPLGDSALEQASFQGLSKMLEDKTNLTPEEQQIIEGWQYNPEGAQDETGQTNVGISPIDAIYTDTSAQELSQYMPQGLNESDVMGTEIKAEPEKEKEIVAEDTEIAQAPEEIGAEWMTPDKINYYGAMKDRSRIRKFLPWAPRTELEVPTPTYLDPTRELGQQSEYANLMAQQLGQFTGPQAFASNMSSIQGTGAEQAANTLSRINNQNVGIANQFAQNAANIRNQEQGINQAAAQRLYDQNTIANQQFINSKIAADQNVRQGFNTGWKNASNLALTNAMYPQYDISARSGNIRFQGGKDYVPTKETDLAERTKAIYKGGVNDWNVAERLAKNQLNPQVATIDKEAILNNIRKEGGAANMGYVMGSNVFPFMFY
jgi:hypothetical protein